MRWKRERSCRSQLPAIARSWKGDCAGGNVRRRAGGSEHGRASGNARGGARGRVLMYRGAGAV